MLDALALTGIVLIMLVPVLMLIAAMLPEKEK